MKINISSPQSVNIVLKDGQTVTVTTGAGSAALVQSKALAVSASLAAGSTATYGPAGESGAEVALNLTLGTATYEVLSGGAQSSVSGAGLGVRRAALRSALLTAVQTGLMSSPPTISVGADNASSTVVTDATCWSPPNPPTGSAFTHLSGKVVPFSAGNYGGGYITEQYAGSTNGWGYGFSTDGEAIDICFRDVTSSAFRFRVREPGQGWKWVSLTDTAVGAAGSNFKWIKLDFGGVSKDRDIEVYCHASNQIRGMVVGKSAGSTAANNPYKIWATSAVNIAAMVWGDSYTASVGATGIRDGFTYVMGDDLGIANIVASGVGGQGYIATSNNQHIPAIDRVADVSAFGTLDWLDVALGINDYQQSASAITAAVSTLLAQFMTRQPTALITVSGPWSAPGKIATAAVENAIKSGFDAVADMTRMAWIPTVADGWQDTSGGNSALYMSGDNVHPNSAGHAYLGHRRAAAVRKALFALTA